MFVFQQNYGGEREFCLVFGLVLAPLLFCDVVFGHRVLVPMRFDG
ncbi:unnamed protein product [Acidithrix sp. C25]|nr:unnamed protein product [Acidithrix sp. C25]